MSCYVMLLCLCYVRECYVMFVMLRYVTLRYVTLCYGMVWYGMVPVLHCVLSSPEPASNEKMKAL